MIPERYAPMTYALFRVVFGFVFLSFGLQKLLGWFGGPAAPLVDLRGYAGLIETVTGLLIMIGLFTKYAAFLASGEMAVAYFYIHVSVIAMGDKGPGIPTGLHPLLNGGVNAALFSVAFLYIATHGPGICSVDGAMARPGTRRS